MASVATKSSYTYKIYSWISLQVLGVHITFLGATTFSTDQEPHIQGPKVTILSLLKLNITSPILNTMYIHGHFARSSCIK